MASSANWAWSAIRPVRVATVTCSRQWAGRPRQFESGRGPGQLAAAIRLLASLHGAQDLLAAGFACLAHEDLDVLGRLGPVEEVALREVAAARTQLLRLRRRLHAL